MHPDRFLFVAFMERGIIGVVGIDPAPSSAPTSRPRIIPVLIEIAPSGDHAQIMSIRLSPEEIADLETRHCCKVCDE